VAMRQYCPTPPWSGLICRPDASERSDRSRSSGVRGSSPSV